MQLYTSAAASSSISSIWELVRNAAFWALSLGLLNQKSGPPGDFAACSGVRYTGVKTGLQRGADEGAVAVNQDM